MGIVMQESKMRGVMRACPARPACVRIANLLSRKPVTGRRRGIRRDGAEPGGAGADGYWCAGVSICCGAVDRWGYDEMFPGIPAISRTFFVAAERRAGPDEAFPGVDDA